MPNRENRENRENWTPERLRRELHLSNRYTGKEVDIFDFFNSLDTYKSVDFFEGREKVLNPEILRKNTTKLFRFRVINTTDSNQILVILPGGYPVVLSATIDSETGKYRAIGGADVNAPAELVPFGIVTKFNNPAVIKASGHYIDAVADDGDVLVIDDIHKLSITTETAGSGIQKFIQYIKENPTLFVGLEISVNNDNLGIFESNLNITKLDPFTRNGENIIPFQGAWTSENLNAKKIEVKKEFVLSGRNLVTIAIPAGTDATLTMKAGASLAIDKGFAKDIQNALLK